MRLTLQIFQIITAIILIIFIILQARGTGFGRGWSSGSFARRGLEKIIFKATFVIAAIFIIISLISLLIP